MDDVCDIWENKKLINPLTKHAIKKDGDIYKKFSEFCKNKKKNCKSLKKNPTINPLTNNKLSDKSKILEFFGKLCRNEVKEAKKEAKKAVKKIVISDYSSITPLQCTAYKTIKLKDHQKNVCNYLNKNPSIKGLILFHSVGSGKTITSITIIRCLLKEQPKKKVFVITPTSLVDNFSKELLKSGVKFGPNVEIITHTKFTNKVDSIGPEFCKDAVLIIDEAHHFKSEITTGYNAVGKRSKLMMDATNIASQVFLLTATPIQNRTKEFTNLYAMISGEEHNVNKLYKVFDSESRIYNKDEVKMLIKNKISYFKNSDTSEYPSSTYHTIDFRMTPAYYNLYMDVENNEIEKINDRFKNKKRVGEADLKKFINGVRRAVNFVDESVSTPKVEWIVDFVKKNVLKKNPKKVLIYSNWIKNGLELIQDKLDEEDIDWVEINGSMSSSARKTSVNKYNGTEKNKYKDNKVSVILVSSSGSEGLDLKNTRSVLILEPNWNNEKLNQVIGRAVRYRSHEFLNKSDQTVDIYNLILKKPENNKDEYKSADEYLQDMSSEKDGEINNFYDILIESSIESKYQDLNPTT